MPTPDPAAQDAHYQVILAGLLDDGAAIAADLAAENSPAVEKAEAYERISRAIRRTIVLARHITAHPVTARENPVEAAKAAIARRRAAHTQREAPSQDAESRIDPRERPDDPALDLDIVQRHPDTVIEEIRRDLGDPPSPPPRPRPNFEIVDPKQPRYLDADDVDDVDDDEQSALVASLVAHAAVRDG